MKIFLAVLLVALCYVNAEVTPEDVEKLHNIMKECKEKHEVTDEDVALLMQHKVPESEAGRCFAGCIKKKMGILDADNKVDMVRVTEVMEKIKDKVGDKYEPLIEVFKTCAAENEGGADECEVTAKLMECCIREMKAKDLKINFMNLLSS